MAQNNSSPVFFSIPGLNENTESNNSGFNSPPETETMEAYKIPPVLWLFIFLVGGYLLTRYALEES
jgi:hypothetical protein